jgi:hypothetical protein
MVMEFIYLAQDINMKEIMKKIKDQDKENIHQLMVQYI